MFATRLGQCLRLPMPDVEVIEVSDWLIAHTPELRMQTGGSSVPCSTGRQLASRYIAAEDGSTFDYLPDSALSRLRNLQDFARVLVLDKWACNCDGRQAIFTRAGRRFSATFIDQGYCFNAGEWNFADSPMRGVCPRPAAYEHVTGWESFEPALTLAEEIDCDALWNCASDIPGEWYGCDDHAIRSLVEALYLRRRNIRPLIESFRKSNRNPFPNWKHTEAVSLSDCKLGLSQLWEATSEAVRL
jgi:hypothetical protein